MNLLDLYEQREPYQQAIDKLEQSRIDDLHSRMDDLVARAKQATDPAHKAALVKEFQKYKAERDSYYSIREGSVTRTATGLRYQADPSRYGGYEPEPELKGLNKTLTKNLEKGMGIEFKKGGQHNRVQPDVDENGIPGNVPTEKIPGKEDLLKGRGRTYYENQKKNSEQVDEYISMGSDKNYQEAEPYKNYRIYVRKKPFGNTGMYTAHTEIDRKEFMGKGSSQEEAVQAVQDRIDFVLNAQKKVTGSSTIDFNVKFATDLLADPRQTFYAKLENINGEPKLVIANAEVASDPELLAAGDFKRSALRNQPDDSGRATPLPGIPLTAKGLRSGDWIANGRYTVGKETSDRDGNRVFDLTYHSTAHTKSDKLRLNQPAFTLGTAREVDEHGGGIGPKQRWQDLMPEQMNPEDDDWYDDEEETDLRTGDYVRDTMDGESGEIFRMQGDPYERRVRILDRDDRGWYIEPSRLTRVDPTDPDIQRYFGKKRVRDMDENTAQDLRSDLAKKYSELAPRITRYKDSYQASELYNALEGIAEQHGAMAEFRKIMNGARNRAHMEYDTNPGGFENWFWFLPFADDGVAEGWSDAIVSRRTGQPRTPYSVYIKGRKWKDFANDDHARAVMDKLKAKFKAEGRDPSVITIAPTDIPEGVTEDQDTSGVEQAILKRIMVAHIDLLRQYGPEKVMQAAEEVAYNVGDVDEIGTSDVSAYVNQVKQILGAVQEGLRDPKDNPCWKGYHPVGTKEKNGRTVPNCVPSTDK